MEGNRNNRNNRSHREEHLPTKQGKSISENSDWVVLDKDVKGVKGHTNKDQVLPNYICHWDVHNFLNDYFDEHFKDLGNPTTITTTKHFVFIGTTLSYVLKFRYYNLERKQRKFSPKVEKFFWTDTKENLGSVLRISVLITKNYKASSSFPVLVSYENRDCVIWRNNFFNKPHLRFSFKKYKPRYTTAEFLLDECVVFDTEGEKIQFWDFKTKKSIIWKNFLDPTDPDAFLGCQLETFKFSESLAFLGLVHDNKIQIHTYKKGDEQGNSNSNNNPHGTTELVLQKPTDHRYSRHRVIRISIGKLHIRPFIGILEDNNFYFYEYLPISPDPRKNTSEFNERRVCLRNRIIFSEPYDRVMFQNFEFLLWNSEHLCVYHPFQNYLDISESPRDYVGDMERLTESSLLFFGNKNGEFLSFELFDRNYRYVRKLKKHKIERDQMDEENLKFIERDAVCIVSENDSLKDDQVSGTKFGNKFFLGEGLRQNVLIATNEAQDVIYVCTMSPISIISSSNFDYTYLKYPSFPCIMAFNLRNNTWRTVLDLSQSQTVEVRPIERNFPTFFSGMYYRKKDHCLLLVSSKLVYEVDIISRSIKGVLTTKKNLVFKKKLEFPNIYFDCSCIVRKNNNNNYNNNNNNNNNNSSNSMNQIFILGEERSLVSSPPSEPIFIADSLCLYSIDLEKRNISLLENMNRNEVISKCANKKLFAFHMKKPNNTIKIYVVCDEYPFIYEKKGRTWEAVPIPFVEPPLKEGEDDEEIEEKEEEEENEGEEGDLFGSSGDLYVQQQQQQQQSNGRGSSSKKKIKKRGLRISKFFISTVCRTPASILFLVDANTPRYRKFFNPYIFEYSVTHQRWKRPLSIESVTLTQVLSASRGCIYLYKNGRRKIMLYNETVFHSEKSFERDFISVQFM